MLRIFVFIIIIAGPVVWYLYSSSKDDVIAEMIAASQNNDVSTMAERFHWEDIRAQLKTDIRARKNAMGSYGTMIGPDLNKIDDVVDYYVQPENIEIAYYYHAELFPDTPESAFIQNISYVPPFGFSVLLGYPEQNSSTQKIDPVLSSRLQLRLIFRLDGLTWKVRKFEVPIFMVPRRTYGRPAIEYFGPINY